MSKTKTLFTVALLILFGSIGAAQAQLARYEFVAVPEPFAREGGLAEKSGPVYIITTATGETRAVALFRNATVTLDYSVPISTAVTSGWNGGWGRTERDMSRAQRRDGQDDSGRLQIQLQQPKWQDCDQRRRRLRLRNQPVNRRRSLGCE